MAATLGKEKAEALFDELFQRLDADKDGGITWNELESNIGKIDNDKAKMMMEMADVNKDDRIEFAEFMSFITMILKAEKLTMQNLTQDHVDHFYALFGVKMCMQKNTLAAAPTATVHGLLGLAIELTTAVIRPNGRRMRIFASDEPASAGSIHQLLLHGTSAMHCSFASCVFAVVLLKRAKMAITPDTLARTFLTALSVASKWQDDLFQGNAAVAGVCGVSTRQMKDMEIAFLRDIDLDCYVADSDYAVTLSMCLEHERSAYVALGLTTVEPAMLSVTETSYRVTRQTGSIGLLFHGSRVIGVVPNSASEAAGLVRGMVIRTINGIAVASQADVATAIQQAGCEIDIEIGSACSAAPAPFVPAWLPAMQAPAALVSVP